MFVSEGGNLFLDTRKKLAKATTRYFNGGEAHFVFTLAGQLDQVNGQEIGVGLAFGWAQDQDNRGGEAVRKEAH